MSKPNPRRANGSRRTALRKRVAAMGLPCALCGQPIDYALPAGHTIDLCQDFGHFCLRFYAAKGSTSQAFKVLSKNASITSAGTR